MTDEQFGRAWAKQQGITPMRCPVGWTWASDAQANSKHFIGGVLRSVLCCQKGFPIFRGERRAYIALGASVRDIHRQVPTLMPVPSAEG